MNPDQPISDALARLGEPLPPEYSLADRVMERLDQEVARFSNFMGVDDACRGREHWGRRGDRCRGRRLVRRHGHAENQPCRRPRGRRETALGARHVRYRGGKLGLPRRRPGILEGSNEARSARSREEDSSSGTGKMTAGSSASRGSHLSSLATKRKKVRIPELDFSDIDARPPRRATEQERRDFPVFNDYEIETIDGRRYGRIDHYVRDRIGEARLEKQTWVDLQTKLPWKRRERMQVADQTKYKREFRTATFAFPTSGPKELFDLGVPPLTPIVDQATIEAEGKLVEPAAGSGQGARGRWCGDPQAAERFSLDRRRRGPQAVLGCRTARIPAEFIDAYVAKRLDQGGPSIYQVKPPEAVQGRSSGPDGRSERPSRRPEAGSAERSRWHPCRPTR